MVSMWWPKPTSKAMAWAMTKKPWPRIRIMHWRTWNVINAMSNVASTTQVFSFGHSVTKQAMDRTSKRLTIGLRRKTQAAWYNTNKPEELERQISIAQCIWVMTDARNTARTINTKNRLSNANMLMPWVTQKVVSRSIGTSSASIRSIKVDSFGIL